jgi:hypothetical protein
MAIDDPLDAAEASVAMDRITDSPLTRYATDLADVAKILPAECLPPGLPQVAAFAKSLTAAFGWIVRKQEEERRQYLSDTLRDELKRVRSKLEQLGEEHKRFVKGEFWTLVTDGLQRAERTRSINRIARIAKILANAAVEGPSKPADMTEELMRVAMDIGDEDARVLAELVHGQRDQMLPGTGGVDYESANNYWRSGIAKEFCAADGGPASRLGVTQGQLQSHCAKLQAFGLIVQVPPNPMKIGSGVVPYSVLRKAIDFVDAIRSPGAD